MANDQTDQKRILQEAQDRARRQEIATRIANAQRIKKLIALDELTIQQKEAIPLARSEEELSTILGQLHINEQHELWLALQDWPYRDMPVPVEPPPSQTGVNQPDSPSGPGVTGLAAGAAGVFLLAPESYKDAVESVERHANLSLSQWEREEEELKKSRKTPPPGRPKTREEAYERAHNESYDDLVRKNHYRAKRWALKNPDDTALAQALDRRELQRKDLTYQELKDLRNKYLINETEKWKTTDPGKRSVLPDHLDLADREFHDRLLLHSPEQAREWAKAYNNPELHVAIERKRQADEERRNNSNIRKKYYESGLEEKVSKAKTKLKKSKAGKAFTRVSDGYKKITDIPSRTKDYLTQTRIGKTISKIRNKINYAFGAPGRAYNRVKSRILSSRLGRFGSKLNRIGKRIKNLLNPVSFLTRFFARTLIKAAIAGVVGFISSVLSFVVVALISFIAGVTGLATATIALVVSAVGWPVTLGLALIFFLIFFFTFFHIPCLIFCNDNGVIQESPYVGISYSIIAEDQDGRINNGENLKYTIIISHNRDEAQIPLEDVTLYSLIPPGTIFVSATGNYDLSEPGKISWKLYPENQTTQDDFSPNKAFVFNLVVDPDNDIVVNNRISIDGGITVNPIGDNLAPNDNFCEGNIYEYVLRNDLLPKNYGDPSCTLDTAAERDQLYALLQSKDPQWADFWFNIIIPGESGYRPNTWARPVPDEEDPRDVLSDTGAWGLFQMGSTDPPGKLTNRSGTYRGDLTWPEQVDTAIARNNYLEKRGLLFKYWQVAIEYCRNGRLNEPQCRDM